MRCKPSSTIGSVAERGDQTSGGGWSQAYALLQGNWDQLRLNTENNEGGCRGSGEFSTMHRVTDKQHSEGMRAIDPA